jgi:hypothetical protein
MTANTRPPSGFNIDMAYHQARVLLLVDAVSRTAGTGRKLDGLTKLAKLDFLVRYPTLATRVVDELSGDPRINPSQDDYLESEAPMIRYKYGPWDNRYYPVIGALVGKGLLAYTRGARGSVALRPTRQGKKLAGELASSPAWNDIYMRCEAVAEHVGAQNGNKIKELIYERLPEIMDRPHREAIRP